MIQSRNFTVKPAVRTGRTAASGSTTMDAHQQVRTLKSQGRSNRARSNMVKCGLARIRYPASRNAGGSRSETADVPLAQRSSMLQERTNILPGVRIVGRKQHRFDVKKFLVEPEQKLNLTKWSTKAVKNWTTKSTLNRRWPPTFPHCR